MCIAADACRSTARRLHKVPHGFREYIETSVTRAGQPAALERQPAYANAAYR
ncbi:hypothetical protein BSLA_02f3088 [Burkholderia stabilis]|nr:hypothetical protein BSLA_02f3088 [Burkholderia stabilis]